MDINDLKILTAILYEDFKKIGLTAKETAFIINRSEDSLKKDREEAIGIPFTRLNNKEKGKPIYLITSIAKTLLENQKKVA